MFVLFSKGVKSDFEEEGTHQQLMAKIEETQEPIRIYDARKKQMEKVAMRVARESKQKGEKIRKQFETERRQEINQDYSMSMLKSHVFENELDKGFKKKNPYYDKLIKENFKLLELSGDQKLKMRLKSVQPF